MKTDFLIIVIASGIEFVACRLNHPGVAVIVQCAAEVARLYRGRQDHQSASFNRE
jgi:hypothetical protein